MTSSEHGASPGRILVVEDDPVVGGVLAHLLGQAGFEVTHTPDPAADWTGPARRPGTWS